MVGLTRQEEADNVSPDPRWTHAEYRRECTEMVNVGCFGAITVDDFSLVMNDQINFQADAALGA